jgi:hypothetical protein
MATASQKFVCKITFRVVEIKPVTVIRYTSKKEASFHFKKTYA